jgi:hypothetical protein
VISVRQIPPLSLGSTTDQVLFGALTDGPSLIVFPVMRPHADVVTAAAVASAKSEPLNRRALPEASAVVMMDAHAMVYALKPAGIIVELDGGTIRPSIITGTDLSGEFIPISPSLMALLASVWGLSVLTDEAQFAEFAVAIPQGDRAVEWNSGQLSRMFGQMISTRFDGIKFETDVPEHLAIRLGLLEGAEA